MTIAEIQKKLLSKGIDIKSTDINHSYVFRLSNGATVLVAYRNNNFKNIQVNGKDECKEETLNILGGVNYV